MNIITCRGITKRFGKKQVLDHVNLTLDQGDIYGLIGVNGAGKTTLLRIILGVSFSNKGEVCLFEEPVAPHLRKRVGSLLTSDAFFPRMTGYQNLLYYQMLFNEVNRERIDEVLELVGLHEPEKIFAHYSLGMKQRLGLALAILREPKLIVLDEPLNGLDPISIAEMRELIVDLHKKGVSFLISSHNLPELEQVATVYGIMDRGRLICEISSEELKQICENSHLVVCKTIDQPVVLHDPKILMIQNRIIIPGNVDLGPVMKEIECKGYQIDTVEEYQMSLEDYFRLVVRNGNKQEGER